VLQKLYYKIDMILISLYISIYYSTKKAAGIIGSFDSSIARRVFDWFRYQRRSRCLYVCGIHFYNFSWSHELFGSIHIVHRCL